MIAIIDKEESSASDHPYITSGKHLGAVRKWIKWNCPNGERVTWGSDDSVGKMTVAQLEEIAQRVAEVFYARIEVIQENHKKDGQHILAGIEKGSDLNWIRAWLSDIANGKGHGGIQS
jgi:hypothetical protein